LFRKRIKNYYLDQSYSSIDDTIDFKAKIIIFYFYCLFLKIKYTLIIKYLKFQKENINLFIFFAKHALSLYNKTKKNTSLDFVWNDHHSHFFQFIWVILQQNQN